MRCTKSTGCRREHGHTGGCGVGVGRTFEDIRTLDALVDRRIGFDGQPIPTVPLSEHQRVQAEAAAMRRALEAQQRANTAAVHVIRDFLSGRFRAEELLLDRADDMAREALKVDAGHALLDEMEGLRKERDALVTFWRDEWAQEGVRGDDAGHSPVGHALVVLRQLRAESADLCAQVATLKAQYEVAWTAPDRLGITRLSREELAALLSRLAHAMPLPAWADGQRLVEEEVQRARTSEEALALQVADLRARLETAEGAAKSSHVAVEQLRADRTRLEAEIQRQQRATAAEVRRAVDQERAETVRELRARAAAWEDGSAVGHALEVAAAAIRARGKE